jgi:hypothetical protein
MNRSSTAEFVKRSVKIFQAGAGIVQKAKQFHSSTLLHKASRLLGDPGSVHLLVAALPSQLSKGLRMARVDHPDEI